MLNSFCRLTFLYSSIDCERTRSLLALGLHVCVCLCVRVVEETQGMLFGIVCLFGVPSYSRAAHAVETAVTLWQMRKSSEHLKADHDIPDLLSLTRLTHRASKHSTP